MRLFFSVCCVFIIQMALLLELGDSFEVRSAKYGTLAGGMTFIIMGVPVLRQLKHETHFL